MFEIKKTDSFEFSTFFQYIFKFINDTKCRTLDKKS